jgi:hypothetical protein
MSLKQSYERPIRSDIEKHLPCFGVVPDSGRT